MRSTHLGGELVHLVSLDGVDGHRVVGVNGSETGRDYETKFTLGQSRSENLVQEECAPKNFLEVPADSMTSTRPGRRASTVGTWLARIPMSPEAAGMLLDRIEAKEVRWYQHPLQRASGVFRQYRLTPE